MLLICYPKCSTCQKAKKWLDGKDIAYTERNIAEENPTYEELKEWYEKSGLPLKKFFNTSGLLYKSMQLKDNECVFILKLGKCIKKNESKDSTEFQPKNL